jgi:hypothetical protein
VELVGHPDDRRADLADDFAVIGGDPPDAELARHLAGAIRRRVHDHRGLDARAPGNRGKMHTLGDRAAADHRTLESLH